MRVIIKPSDKYIGLWLEQVRQERKRAPFGSASVDFDVWENILMEIQQCRAMITAHDEANGVMSGEARHMDFPEEDLAITAELRKVEQ